MNNPAKKIEVDVSSLVSLKAELIRKQREFQQDRQNAQSAGGRQVKTKIKKVKDDPGAKNPGVHGRASLDLEQRIEEEKKYTNARDILEKKAKLYEEMASGRMTDEGESVLVDFHQKNMIRRQEEEQHPQSEEKEKWEQSIRLKGDRAGLGSSAEETVEKLDIHYSDVLHKEIRSHGVGYYQFSKDDEKRKEQMEQLEKLRSQTVEQKMRKDRIKEKREAMMQQRLAKLRQRRGLPDPPADEVSPPEKKAPVEPEPLLRDDTWRKEAPITREWDKGKKVIEDYETKRRNERNPEFAPPSSLYEDDWNVQQPRQPQRKKPYDKISNNPQLPKPSKDSKEATVAVSIAQQLKELRSEFEEKDGKSGEGASTSDVIPLSTHQSGQETTPDLDDIRSIPLPGETPKTGSLQIRDKELTLSSALPADNMDTFDTLPHTVSEGTPTTSSQIQHIPVPPCPPPGFIYPPPPILVPPHLPPPPPPVSLPSTGQPLTSLDTHSGYCTATYSTPNTEHLIQPQWCNTTTSGYNTVPSATNNGISVPQISDGINSVNNLESVGGEDVKGSQAPQPAHYSSAPQKVQQPGPRYERVHLHTVPASLPAPPSLTHMPKYKAQDGSFIPEFKGQKSNKKNLMHMWNQQYQYTDKDK